MKNFRSFIKTSFLFLISIGIILFLFNPGLLKQFVNDEKTTFHEPSPVEKKATDDLTIPDLILLGARSEVNNGTVYDASYKVIPYPGGDVPTGKGACTDVIIRALRNADIDLQQLIHVDMRDNFDIYPQNWGLSGPDSNIDHRRVPNQMQFFHRHGLELSLDVEKNLDDWNWGDVVYWRFCNGDEHCGIISDRKNNEGIPLVIHNAGLAKEEDCLTRWEITGHYRYPIE